MYGLTRVSHVAVDRDYYADAPGSPNQLPIIFESTPIPIFKFINE